MPSCSRPGPLQPYDISLFVPAGPPGTPSGSRPNKRPHSPSVGSFGVPAKRRLKAAEGTQTPKFVKSPLSGSSSSGRFAPAHFHALLQGPDSPAKRLNLGSSEASDSTACEAPLRSLNGGGGGSGTPRRSPKRPSQTRLRRSPRLSTRSPGSSSGSPRQLSGGQTGADDADAAARVAPATPMFIPRVVTPPDPQSVHYPGFVIFQDPHIMVPSTSQFPADFVSDSEQEPDKENRAPRCKSSKKSSTLVIPSDATWEKNGLSSPSKKSSYKTLVPSSPHPKHVKDYLMTPRTTLSAKAHGTHFPVSPATTLVGATPNRTPLGKEERKKMRLAMEEEADDVEGDDELVL